MNGKQKLENKALSVWIQARQGTGTTTHSLHINHKNTYRPSGT